MRRARAPPAPPAAAAVGFRARWWRPGPSGASADSNSMSEGATSSSSGGAPSAMRVAVTAARFVATWRWNVTDDDDVCGICRLAFEHCCPGCKLPGDDCPPILGACKHAFHLHCITTWLSAKDKEQVCPLCRRVWEMG